jgi:uncharacterized protein YecE (DUF72 family)
MIILIVNVVRRVFLIQLPPSLQIAEGLDLIKNLQYLLDPPFRYAIEVRHHSWFSELFYNYLKEKNYCLVWSQQDTIITPPVVTTDFVYLRLIEERSIDERDFWQDKKRNAIWTNITKDIQNNEKNVKNAIIAANNHYAGFSPMTTKLFVEMMNLENKVKSFPIVDYNLLRILVKLQITKILKSINKSINNYIPRQDKLTFLNFLNNFNNWI